MSVFIDNEHSVFFGKMLSESKTTDAYHRALFYTLGLSEETRSHIHRIYNQKDREIQPECLEEGWQTGTSRRICLFAFNLFNGYVDKENPNASTPESLFDCNLAPYFAKALAIRFPNCW